MFVGICAFATLVIPALLLAQTDYVPLAPLPNTILNPTTKVEVPECNPLNPDALKPGMPGYNETCKTSGLSDYLTGIYKTGIAAAGVLAVLMLVWGGFQYMTTEAVSGKSESKGVIMNVVWGLATGLASYVLLYTIKPRLVDIGLAIGKLNPVTKTRIPSNVETYGKFLDEALKRAQDISTKARDIRIDIETLEKQIEEGGYKDAADGQRIINEINKLKTKEAVVRNYENTNLLLDDTRQEIRHCLSGGGQCAVATMWGLLESGDIESNNEQVQKILQAARIKVNKDKIDLVNAGAQDRADTLEQKMKNIENSTAFYIRCPNSQVTYVHGKGYETGPCP